MYVFIDESGDPGFKLDKGASPIFVAAMVIFRNSEDVKSMADLIENSDVRRRHKGEFKFNKCSNDIRDAYFHCVVNGVFRVRAIVVSKNVIYSPRLRRNKESFYEYFVKSMMRYDAGRLREAKVIIDGSGDREFRQNLSATLRRQNNGAVKSVNFKDSARDPLVQLADMCVGAIARSYREDRESPLRWRKMLAPKIDDVWDFR